METRQDFCLDALQGSDEQRTESYQVYGEGAAQLVTRQCAKSTGGVTGFASEQASATGGLR